MNRTISEWNKQDRIFHNTPGALGACMPHDEYPNGFVTVECDRILQAAKYLAKYYNVVGTRVGNMLIGTTPTISIVIEVKCS